MSRKDIAEKINEYAERVADIVNCDLSDAVDEVQGIAWDMRTFASTVEECEVEE